MSFITIRFGDDNHALFNPNCLVINLLDNIRKRCKCEKEAPIDLSDEDGSVQKLSEKQDQNASTILKQRGEYILLRVEKFSEKPNVYLPLLNGLEYSNPALLAKLQNTSKPEEEHQKQTIRKKSPWDRANVRKVTSRAREQSNVSPAKTDGGRENTPKSDDKTLGGNSDRRTAKQRKPGLKTI
ncbi:Hypothetical predicted protein [Paramuricea clavata]|uniref:Uncharacterized protein n=1 Tax=Paramuricea clavata TaxID=317549 RepID=A0A6S7G0M9_PARCT|nr:Hypothetical predicted protein [Paramuricea clavata]